MPVQERRRLRQPPAPPHQQAPGNHTSLAWAPYGEHWRNLRKIASLEILSSHRLQMLSCIRSDEVRSLVRRLLPPPSSSTPDRTVDVNSALVELKLNVMMRMIAGKRYYGDDGTEVEEARRFREMALETFQVSQSGLEDFLPAVRWAMTCAQISRVREEEGRKEEERRRIDVREEKKKKEERRKKKRRRRRRRVDLGRWESGDFFFFFK